MRPEEPSRADEQRLLEAIDACRSGSDDHKLPETAFLGELFERDHASQEIYRRVQKLDASIESAIARVPVPTGLENRLLAALAAARAAETTASAVVGPAVERSDAVRAAIESSEPVSDDAAARTIELPVRRRTSRRVWVASGLATAAALLVAYWFWPANEYTHEGVLAFGQDYFSNDKARGTGVEVEVKAPPAGYRLSRFVNARANPEWRRIEHFLGRSGVAYDLKVAGAEATLYVVKVAGTPKSARILPGAGQAPLRQPASSGVRPTDAWVENGFLYVLVVDGNEQDYQQFISSGGAVT